jgi:hypothetical protein
MSVETETKMEALLKELNPTAPSAELDSRIQKLASPALPLSRNRGWKTLVATAIAASVVGIVIGQMTSFQPRVAASSASNVGGKDLTPVNFNPNAFALLHLHSTKPEYETCSNCHVNGETIQAFDGWYYGDAKLLKSHSDFKMSECVDCHVLAPAPNEKPDTPDINLHSIKGVKCSDCHSGANEPIKPVTAG